MESQSPTELRAHIQNLNRLEYVVDNLLPNHSVALLAGDSGQGKTPFCIQLAVAVASGQPFLEHKTYGGPVLYADYENAPELFDRIASNISRTLGLTDTPEILRRLDHPNSVEIENEVKKYRPSLIIIDTLRFLDEIAETESSKAAYRMRWFKKLAKTGACVLFVHHMRKESSEFPRPALDSGHVLEWMQYVSGASALVQQCDIRMGLEEIQSPDYDVVFRAYKRTVGDGAPLRLERILDDNSGDPLAYKLYKSPKVIPQKIRDDVAKLPSTPFTFKEATHALIRSKKYTAQLLRTAVSLGLLIRTGTFLSTRYQRGEGGGVTV